jgi:hypothetical protein
MPGCPIRTSADQFVCADPRSFSQLTASFFASESLGIRHTPLTISFLFLVTQALVSARFFLCDIFTVNVNDLYAINNLIRKYLFWLYLLFNIKQSTMVENKGVEPLTSCVQGRRSSQLS